MLIAIYKFRKEVYIKKNLIGKDVLLQDMRDKSQTLKYPAPCYHRDFVEWELIKGGKE